MASVQHEKDKQNGSKPEPMYYSQVSSSSDNMDSMKEKRNSMSNNLDSSSSSKEKEQKEHVNQTNNSPTSTTTQTNNKQQPHAMTQQVSKEASSLPSIHSFHPQKDLKLNNRFMLLDTNDQIRELQTVIRDKTTSRGDFKFFADRLIRLVVEEGLNQLPVERVEVETPTGQSFLGIRYLKGNCGVSIVRSGESMEQGLRDCCRSIRIGKILIESDENNQARVLYIKFPHDIARRKILLLYPIMSTGRAVIESVRVLLNHGVREENLILLNLFSSPRAARTLNQTFPKMFALTSDINRVCPNHFGQRYFGTD